jgi:hypothetical protein
MSDENTQNTPPVTPETPQAPVTPPAWKEYAPQFNSEVDLAQGFRTTKAQLTQTQQELAALKQKQTEDVPQWDWADPTKIYDTEKDNFNPDFSSYLQKSTGAPEPVIKELLDTVTKARQIIREQTTQKWDKVAGIENAQSAVVEYLQANYQGQDLQNRLDDLNHPRFWEQALKSTVQEMGDKNWKGKDGKEPTGLPNVLADAGGVIPLDPFSAEAATIMGSLEYRSDPSKQKEVERRIAVWRKNQK